MNKLTIIRSFKLPEPLDFHGKNIGEFTIRLPKIYMPLQFLAYKSRIGHRQYFYYVVYIKCTYDVPDTGIETDKLLPVKFRYAILEERFDEDNGWEYITSNCTAFGNSEMLPFLFYKP